MCGHKCSQGVENKYSRRCRTMEPGGMGNFCRVHEETIETCAFFRSVTTILPTKRPPFWGPKTGHQNGVHSFSLNLICLCPGDLAPFWGPFWTPNGVVLSAKFCHRAKNSASFDCFRGYATEVLHTAGFPWFYSAASNCSPRPANMYVRAYS